MKYRTGWAILRTIRQTGRIRREGFSFLSGKYAEDLRQRAFDSLVKSTVELCAYAEEKGVPRVAMEVFDYDVDKCSLIGPAALARKYAEAVCARVNKIPNS